MDARQQTNWIGWAEETQLPPARRPHDGENGNPYIRQLWDQPWDHPATSDRKHLFFSILQTFPRPTGILKGIGGPTTGSDSSKETHQNRIDRSRVWDET